MKTSFFTTNKVTIPGYCSTWMFSGNNSRKGQASAFAIETGKAGQFILVQMLAVCILSTLLLPPTTLSAHFTHSSLPVGTDDDIADLVRSWSVTGLVTKW
jgi:hypothetical protein